LAFVTIGLLNRDKWKKNRAGWKKLSRHDKGRMKWIIIALVVFVLGVMAYLILRGGGSCFR